MSLSRIFSAFGFLFVAVDDDAVVDAADALSPGSDYVRGLPTMLHLVGQAPNVPLRDPRKRLAHDAMHLAKMVLAGKGEEGEEKRVSR